MSSIVGLKFSRLTIIADAGMRGKHRLCRCACECGNEKIVFVSNLVGGKTKGCGCRNKGNYRHGYTHSRTYSAWSKMIDRCDRESGSMYYRYGGRGIKVCDRWRDFKNFFHDMGVAPAGMQIDRINNDGDYEPGNCKWSTPTEQANNRSSNRRAILKGQDKTVAEWSRDLGIPSSTLINRLNFRDQNPKKWPDERVCNPNRQSPS